MLQKYHRITWDYAHVIPHGSHVVKCLLVISFVSYVMVMLLNLLNGLTNAV